VTLTSAQALALVGDAVAVLFLLALLVLAALALSSVERGGR